MSSLEAKLQEQQKVIEFLTSRYEKDTGRKLPLPTSLGHLLGDPSILGDAPELEEDEKAVEDGGPRTVSFMEHIENLGHESFPFVDGLNIELLDFQKQALQWCLERERVKGGIQSFFWSKLPQQDGVPELYYNPILKHVTQISQ